MSDLSPDSRALLQMIHGGDDPTEEDHARVRRAVLLRVGAAAGVAGVVASVPAEAAAAGAAATGASLTAKIATVVGLAAVVGAGGAIALHNHEARGPEQARPSVAAVVRAAAGAAATGSEPAEAIATPSPSAEAGTGARPPGAASSAAATREAAASTKAPRTQQGGLPAMAAQSLEDEVRLLQSAQAELGAGRADQALALLDQHAQGFGTGVMAEERRAARILTLCKLGRVAEARAEAGRFVRDFPRSPAAQRMRSACQD